MNDPLADRSLAYALADARERLLPADPRITTIGLGYRTQAGRETREICVQIGVEEKLPPNSLDRSVMLPRAIQPAAGSLERVRVDVVGTGVLSRLDAVPTAIALTGALTLPGFDLRARVRPAVPGCSIGHLRTTAGTLGAVLTDRRRRRFLLSNNHVLANENEARPGDPILQPGPADGGAEADGVIGHLHSFVPLDPEGLNEVDCALAAAERDRDLAPAIYGLGTVIGTGPLELGQKVRKCGRTTGLTAGRVRRVAITARIHYGCGVLVFSGLAETAGMSAPGDSGSLLVDDVNRAVGLLFAGSPVLTLFCPIEAVVKGLELQDLSFC